MPSKRGERGITTQPTVAATIARPVCGDNEERGSCVEQSATSAPSIADAELAASHAWQAVQRARDLVAPAQVRATAKHARVEHLQKGLDDTDPASMHDYECARAVADRVEAALERALARVDKAEACFERARGDVARAHASQLLAQVRVLRRRRGRGEEVQEVQGERAKGQEDEQTDVGGEHGAEGGATVETTEPAAIAAAAAAAAAATVEVTATAATKGGTTGSHEPADTGRATDASTPQRVAAAPAKRNRKVYFNGAGKARRLDCTKFHAFHRLPSRKRKRCVWCNSTTSFYCTTCSGSDTFVPLCTTVRQDGTNLCCFLLFHTTSQIP